MNPYIFTYLMFFLQGLLESYFLCKYLYSKDIKKSFLLSQIILCFLQHPVQMVLFNIQGMKMIFYIIALYIVVFVCFPKNNLKKKIISVVLLMMIILFVEIFAISIEVFTVGLLDVVTVENPHPLHVYLMQLILMYTVSNIVLRYVNKQILLCKTDMLIFTVISVLHVSFLYLFNINISLETVGVSRNVSKVFFLVFSLLSVLSYCGILLYLVRRQEKLENEIILIMLHKEYENQLKYYIEEKSNQTDIKMIRHDLVNYIQSQKYNEQS